MSITMCQNRRQTEIDTLRLIKIQTNPFGCVLCAVYDGTQSPIVTTILTHYSLAQLPKPDFRYVELRPSIGADVTFLTVFDKCVVLLAILCGVDE